MLPGSNGAYQLPDVSLAFPPSPNSQQDSGVAGLAAPLQVGQGNMSFTGLVGHGPAMYVSHSVNSLETSSHIGQIAEDIRTIFVTGFPTEVHARELHNLV